MTTSHYRYSILSNTDKAFDNSQHSSVIKMLRNFIVEILYSNKKHVQKIYIKHHS